MKRKEFILSRNGEHIGWFATREQAETGREQARTETEKFERDGWTTPGSARQIQISIIEER